MGGVHRADALLARPGVEDLVGAGADLLLREAVVERGGRDADALDAQRLGDRGRDLRRRVEERKQTLVILHPVAQPVDDRGGRIERRIDEAADHVVVRTEIELRKLRELPDGVGQRAAEAEVAQVDAGHAAVVVQRDAGLRPPQIGIAVEIPVGAPREALAVVVPLFAVERFPDLIEGVVVLDIVVRLVEADLDVGLGRAVVGHREAGRRRGAAHLERRARRALGRVVQHAVAAGGQRQQRVAEARRSLVAGGAVGFVLPVEVDREGAREVREARAGAREAAGELLHHREVDIFDLVEGIPVGRAGAGGILKIREVFHQGEAHLAAGFDADRQVVHRQTARNDFERRHAGGRADVDFAVEGVVKRIGDDAVGAGQQLELAASQTEFGTRFVGGREGENLRDGRLAVGERDTDLGGFGEVVEAAARGARRGVCGLGRGRGSLVGGALVELELHVAVVRFAVVDTLVVGAPGAEQCRAEREHGSHAESDKFHN